MKKRLVCLAFVLALLSLTACQKPQPEASPPLTTASGVVMAQKTEDELYRAAVLDAMLAEPDEVQQLVCLTPETPSATWNDRGQVLLLTFHQYPESYIAGEKFITKYGEVWTFIDKEIQTWYNGLSEDAADWALRLKQLVGVPYDREYTHISAMWTDPADVKRPSYETDVTKQIGEISFADDIDPGYKAWFDSNIIWSYFDSAYPWTRLGYTYDWADNGREYGLTEFLIRKDAAVTVEFTKTVEEFVAWLLENK
jgi:hypothetical protein